MPLTAAQDIADLLNETRTIALVGISDRPDRAPRGAGGRRGRGAAAQSPLAPSRSGCNWG